MIRNSVAGDYMQIKELLVEAFSKSEYGYTGEAELVDKIRQNNDYLEVVYLEDNKVIGHGLLSDSKIENGLGELVTRGLVLAPLSVTPSHQGQGIGGQLITALEQQVESDIAFISILGDPEYYKRFGYVPANEYAIKPPFDVPEKFFLIKEMKNADLKKCSGTLKYNSSFD